MSVKSDSILESGYSLNSDIKTLELGELVEVQAGGTPDTNEDMYYDGEIPFVSISDMTSSGKYIKTTSSNITEDGLKNSTTVVASDSDVLLSIYASYGKLSLPQNDVSISQAIVRLTIKEEYREEIQREYLYYVLQSMQKVYDRMSAGTTQSNLSKPQIQKLRIPVPPLEEQERIVSLLSDVDEYIEKTSERVHALEQQKQAVLQQVFAVEGDDVNTINPQYRWKSQPIGEICSVTSGSSFPQEYQDDSIEGVPVIKVGDLTEELYIESAEFSVAQNDLNELGHTVYDSGTIILPKNGESIRTAKVNILDSKCAVDNNVMVVSVKSKSVLSEWVAYFLDYYDLIRIAPGTTAPTISNKTMKSLEIPVPSKEEQENIISTLSKIDETIGSSNSDLESMRELKQGLLQNIFSG